MNKRRVDMLIKNGLSPTDAMQLDNILSNDENGISRSVEDNVTAHRIARLINSKGLGI